MKLRHCASSLTRSQVPNTNHPHEYRIQPFIWPADTVELHQRRLIEKLVREVEKRNPPPIEGSWWWIVRDQPVGRPVGYCCMTPAEGNSVGILTTAGVRGLHRGKGLYRRMISSCERQARRAGIRRCEVEVDSDNLWVINNLIDSGYHFGKGGLKPLLFRRLHASSSASSVDHSSDPRTRGSGDGAGSGDPQGGVLGHAL